MVATPQEQDPLKMTVSDYLAFDEQSAVKHEFVNGDVYAMTGASWTHNVICQNVGASLHGQLRGKDCTVVANDMRLKIASKAIYRYPDAMVICGEPQFVDERKDIINNPTVIIEVLSPSTALIDRNEKLDEYTEIPSLKAYLLVAQDDAKIESYQRNQSGIWTYAKTSGLEHQIELPSINCLLALADVYETVRFPDKK